MTAVPPAASGQPISASVVNSFRVAAVAERLATHTQPGRQPQSSEFFSLCLSLARGIDYAIANNEVPAKAQELPLLLKQICQHRNDLFLQAAIMVLMISVKNACKMSWFSDGESRELLTLANEVGSCFCIPGVINNELDGSLSTILEVMSRFYPLMKMGQILASLEAKPGYGALVVDFHISKNMTHSPQEKIRLFVAQKDNVETSACIISPQLVSFLLNGKGVERRTNVLMDMGPQMPTNVTAMLKYGTNLLQAVGQFSGHYLIVVAFMGMEESSPDASTLPDYVQSGDFAPDSDSDLIEGPSRISLKCPISRTRIKTPVKGHACKHLQCFDFNNYVNINSRRPSWRCPHCNQHVCYTNIRVDQNMVKVLKEVAEDVSDVIISADGSWKAVMENDDDVDELHGNTLNCQKDGSERPESATGVPMVLDLTQTVDAMETIETEDRKPPVATLESLSAAPNLTLTPELINLAGANQNVMDDDFWSVLYSGHGSGTSTSRTDTQVGGTESTRNFTVSPVFSDAVSPALNRADAHGNANLATPGIQNQVATTNNLPLHPSQVTNSMSNHEYGSLQNIPRHVSRSSIAVQALPAMSQTQTPTQQRSSNSVNTKNTTSSARIPHQMQSRIQQERSFVPAMFFIAFRRNENQHSFKLLAISRMDLLVSGWNFKQFAIPVSPPPPLPPPVLPPSTATTCSFSKPPSSTHKVSFPFRIYRLARISNKSSSPFAIHARKKNSKSEPLLEPTLVEEVSMDDDDKEDELLLFDDFEDDELMIDNDDDDDDFFEEEYTEDETELYVGDGAGGGGISLAGTWWDKEALLLAENVCQSFGGDLGIYAFKTLSNSSIQVRIERLTNKSGSPSMEDIEAFSVSYRAKLDEAELARSIAENITLEVSSPGVERVVRIPQDLDRFKDRSLYVKYVTEVADSGKLSEADGVFRLVSFDMETKCCIWGLADVRINREKAGKGRPLSKKQREWCLETSFDSLRLVRLYSEI